MTLVETLVGRGYDIKIFDPGISISRLKGRNLAYIDQRLPHLAALLVEDLGQLLEHGELLVLGNDIADEVDLSSRPSDQVVDLRRCLVIADHEAVNV